MNLKKIIAAAMAFAVIGGTQTAFTSYQSAEVFTASAEYNEPTEAVDNDSTSAVTTTTSATALTTTTTTTSITTTTTSSTTTTTIDYIGQATSPIAQINKYTETEIAMPFFYTPNDSSSWIHDIDFDVQCDDKDVTILDKRLAVENSSYTLTYFKPMVKVKVSKSGDFVLNMVINKVTDIGGNDITYRIKDKNVSQVFQVIETRTTKSQLTTVSSTTTTIATTTSAAVSETSSIPPTTSKYYQSIGATIVTYEGMEEEFRLASFGELKNTAPEVESIDYTVQCENDGITILDKYFKTEYDDIAGEVHYNPIIKIKANKVGEYTIKMVINKVTDKAGNDVTYRLRLKDLNNEVVVLANPLLTTYTSTSTILTTKAPYSSATTTATAATTTATSTAAPATTATAAAPSANDERIVGQWYVYMISWQTEKGFTDLLPNNDHYIVIFNNDGTFTVNTKTDTGYSVDSGTWTISGDDLTLVRPDGVSDSAVLSDSWTFKGKKWIVVQDNKELYLVRGGKFTDPVTTTTTQPTTTATASETTTTTTATATETTTSEATTTASTAPSTPVATTADSRLVGKWTETEAVLSNVNGPMDYCFNSDGSGSFTWKENNPNNYAVPFTWSTDGDKLTIHEDVEDGSNIIYTFSFNEGSLVLKNAEGKESSLSKETLPLGDTTGDGKVDAKDASMVLVAYAKVSTGDNEGLSEAQHKAADVNNDGMVDAKDASTVLAYYSLVSTSSGDVPTLEDFARPKEKSET